MVFKDCVFLVLALTALTQVDPTIHTVGRGSGIGTQMTNHHLWSPMSESGPSHRLPGPLSHCLKKLLSSDWPKWRCTL